MIGGILQGAGALIDSTVGLGYNIANSEYNKSQQTANKNWAFADSRAANDMMHYFMKYGSLDGYESNVSGQDYNDVADYFNPYLSLSSLQLSKRAQDLAEQQFKYSKNVTENSTQIRMNDLKKAGLSPLLALGNSASYSPVSISGSALSGNTGKNRPSYNNIASLQGTQLASAIANIRLLDAQTKNINADTSLKNADTSLKEEQTKKTSEDIKKIQEETKLISEKIKNTKYSTMLTQNQIEFVAQQIANLEYDYQKSIEAGVKTFDSTPIMIKEIQSIIEAIGIDLNSAAGQGLTTLLVGGVLLNGGNIKGAAKNAVNTAINKMKGK